MHAAEYIGIPLQKPVLELVNGNWKEYPSNGINFASGGSGVLTTTNQDLVRNYTNINFVYLSTQYNF